MRIMIIRLSHFDGQDPNIIFFVKEPSKLSSHVRFVHTPILSYASYQPWTASTTGTHHLHLEKLQEEK